MIKGSHHSKEANKLNSVAHTGKIASNETKEKMSKSQLKSYKEDPSRKECHPSGEDHPMFGKHHTKETRMMLRNIELKRLIDNPEYYITLLNRLSKASKSFNTKLELVVQKHVQTIIDEPIYTQVPINISHDTIYIVDILIPHIKTVIEVNGCHWHYCVKCRPLVDDIFKAQSKRLYDMDRKFNLERMGFKVIVLWEHDINSGKYKKILRKGLKI